MGNLRVTRLARMGYGFMWVTDGHTDADALQAVVNWMHAHPHTSLVKLNFDVDGEDSYIEAIFEAVEDEDLDQRTDD